MIHISEVIRGWLGWCPNAGTMRTAPAVLMVQHETIHSTQPDGNGPAGSSHRIRHGVSIATGSLKTLVRDRHLLWFALPSGLLMLFLLSVLYWAKASLYYAAPVFIKIPLTNFILWFDAQFLWIMAVCLILTLFLFCLMILMAGLVLYQNANRSGHPLAIREGYAGARAHAGPLAALSMVMALVGTILYWILGASPVFRVILSPVMAAFSLPWDFYFLFGFFLQMPIWETFVSLGTIIFVTLVLFLVLIYVVPVIVLEKKGLIRALAGSGSLVQGTWREILGCILVYGIIVIGVCSIALAIGQYIALLGNHAVSVWEEILSYGFTLVCWILMAACSTAAGVALADLYRTGKHDLESGIPGENLKTPEPAP